MKNKLLILTFIVITLFGCNKDEDNYRWPHMVVHHPKLILGATYELKASMVSLFGNTIVNNGFFVSVGGANDYYVWASPTLKKPGKYSVTETFPGSGFYYVYAVSVIEFSNSTDTVWSDYYVPVEIP